MNNTNLVIAVVFASLLGVFIICSALWCVVRYMHRHCLDLSQYFHTLTFNSAQPAPVVYVEKHCSRAEKSVIGRIPERLQIQRDHENRDCEQGRMRDGNVDMRLMVQPRVPTQAYHESRGQSCRPSLKRKDRVQNMQPMMPQLVPMHWQAQGAHHESPFVMHPEMPQQPRRQMGARSSNTIQSLPRYQPRELPPYRQPHEESGSSEASGSHQQKRFRMKGQSPVEHARRARRVDYVHVCGQYPPIVLEALKKAALASPNATAASSSSSSFASSSSSSNGSGTTQEIPRTDLARTTPNYVTNSPIQSPRHCDVTTGARDLSRMYFGQ